MFRGIKRKKNEVLYFSMKTLLLIHLLELKYMGFSVKTDPHLVSVFCYLSGLKTASNHKLLIRLHKWPCIDSDLCGLGKIFRKKGSMCCGWAVAQRISGVLHVKSLKLYLLFSYLKTTLILFVQSVSVHAMRCEADCRLPGHVPPIIFWPQLLNTELKP